jgi:hypothetical protein
MSNFFIQLLQNTTFIVIAAAITAVILRLPLVCILAYPIRLFITFIHELCHGIAAAATGGSFTQFVVRMDTSGTAWRRGGWSLVVIPAGYLGTSSFSALLILCTRIEGAVPLILSTLGLLIIASVLIFGLRSCTTSLVGLISGVGVIYMAWYIHESWALFLVSVLAIFGTLETLDSLHSIATSVRLGMNSEDDATKMAAFYGCSPIFWTSIWTITSWLMVGGAVWIAWF